MASSFQATHIAGFRPAKQLRSQQVLERLVEVSLDLLRTRTFDEVSVAGLCEAAGVSVGPFYTRFDSKEAFFAFLQHVVIQESESALTEAILAEYAAAGALQPFLREVVHGFVAWYQHNEGVVRASLRLAQTQADAWEPLRRLGARNSSMIEKQILALVKCPDSPLVIETVAFAVQGAIATCNNMVLVNPSPFNIRNPRTADLLTQSMAAQIERAVADAAAVARPRSQGRDERG